MQHPTELTLSDRVIVDNGKVEFVGEYTSTLYDKSDFRIDNSFFVYLFNSKKYEKKLDNLSFIEMLKIAGEWIGKANLERMGFGRHSAICGCIEILPAVGKENNLYLFFGEVSI